MKIEINLQDQFSFCLHSIIKEIPEEEKSNFVLKLNTAIRQKKIFNQFDKKAQILYNWKILKYKILEE